LKGVLIFFGVRDSKFIIQYTICSCVGCYLNFEKNQVLSSYFPCITCLSRTRIPLVCRVLIGSHRDLFLYK